MDTDSFSEHEPGVSIVSSKKRSWVYSHAEKVKHNTKMFFHCNYISQNGIRCNYVVESKQGNTTTISSHLKNKHFLSPSKSSKTESKVIETTTERIPKSFREAFVQLVTKQGLPYSIIGEKALQDAFLAFHREYEETKIVPSFFDEQTLASDISNLADRYVKQMKRRFNSKLSICMDIWTGPNRMSFLGLTFTYLDENFNIQRGLLDLVTVKENYNGVHIANLFQDVMELYNIDKDMIVGVTHNNTSKAFSIVDALVEKGYNLQTFYGCFLLGFNLACQAAIEVYDPTQKRKCNIHPTNDFCLASEDTHDNQDTDYDDSSCYEADLNDVENRSDVIMNARKLIAFINQNDHRRDVLSRCQRICSIDRNVLKQDMKARWNTTYSMIECLIKNEEAIQMLPAIDDTLEWPLLSVNDWNHLKDLDKFLSLFKELSLYFSTTAEPRMSDLCLDFEFLLADIRLEYLEKKDEISDVLWYAANAAYSKLTKYYTKINTNGFCIATVLDPRFKLGAYGNSQAVVGLKATAELAINEAYRKYSSVAGNNITPTTPTPSMTQPRKKKKFSHLSAGQADELSKYLQDPFASSTCDPLEYWRVNKEEFPILAAMARDYLALQPTFKDAQGYFTTGRLTFPYYGQSLNASNIRNQMLVNFGNNSGFF